VKNKAFIGLGIVVVGLIIAACNPSPTPCPPTPDISAIKTEIAQEYVATVTALEAQLAACEDTLTAISEEEPSPPPPETKCGVPTAIPWSDAGRYEGETIILYGPVVDSHFASTSSGQPTFLNLGKPYPDPDRFTVLIWGDERQGFIDAFGGSPEDIFLHRDVCVRGLIEYYEGSYEIILRVPGDIWFQ